MGMKLAKLLQEVSSINPTEESSGPAFVPSNNSNNNNDAPQLERKKSATKLADQPRKHSVCFINIIKLIITY